MAKKKVKRNRSPARAPRRRTGRGRSSTARASTPAAAAPEGPSAEPKAEPGAAFQIPTDPALLREALLRLTPDERAALETHLGAETVEHVVRTARRSRASDRIGKVVVLHGIMGANLDSRRDDDWDRVWVHAWRLAKGRIVDLELSESGVPIPGRPPVRVMGMFADYLPLVVELQRRWEVLPFAYDWRADVDASAARLADAIRDFSMGQPVHIVAHSMGGLVARRFAQRHEELWKAIDEPGKHARGGRLIQLGTPNRGSFAISLVMTGEEPTVKKLALLDFAHSKRELVRLLRGFPGSYQMLPAPDAGMGDDRGRLHDAKAWGEWPVVQELIDRGRAFQEELLEVRDPERLLYVAGYDQDTPDRIRVKKAGEFEYRVTKDGDGRVPHDLGLLAGVRTFYVREAHGDLPKNERVLAGIHELLQRGETGELETALQRRGRRVDVAPAWKSAADVYPDEESELDVLPKRSASRRVWTESSEEVAASLLRGFVGHARPAKAGREAGVKVARRTRATPRVKVVVAHADITRIPADLYAVGHYTGVMPQNAEAAFDRVISEPGAECGVLAREARAGLLSGELGTIQLYPWHARKDRLLAVAGMGKSGTFSVSGLRRVGQALTFRALHLGNVRRLATVLIGSGVGNLSTSEALRALFAGASDALGQYEGSGKVREIWIVDREERKADEILAALGELAKDESVQAHLHLDPAAAVLRRPGGRTTRQAIADEVAAWKRRATHPATDAGPARQITRVAWSRDNDDGMRVAALTSTVVVPERAIPLDLTLLDELVERMTDPAVETVPESSFTLGRLVVPQDFREHLVDSSRLVVELDRYMAGVHWEMLSLGSGTDDAGAPLATTRPLARQLRTEYAPAPAFDAVEERPLRVLIVGDPGDPKTGWNLEGARKEALAVLAKMRELRDRGAAIEVEAFIGAPGAPGKSRPGDLRGLRAAGRLDVLAQLMKGERWDLLHYCGHGDFDPDHPDRVGWVFEDGKFLAASELRRVDVAPRLVVANACLSARTSDRLQRGKRSSGKHSEADLLPSLADEFFHRGVRNYVGTAWEVDDEGAVLFATTFYDELLGNGKSIGNALLAARRVLYDARTRYDSLWGAYQHYGNPDDRVTPPRSETVSGGRAPGRARRRTRRT